MVARDDSEIADIGFADELRRQFEALDDKTGRRTRRTIVTAVVAIIAAAAVAGSLTLVLGGSSSAPDAAQMAAIQSVIGDYLAARAQALAPQDAAYQSDAASVPQSVYDQANARFHAAVARDGTPEFVDRLAGTDIAFALAGERKNGDVMLRSDARVLSLDYMRRLAGGDVVVWAKLWLGDVRRHFASNEVGVGTATTAYVDETPTYQYQMRNVGGEWKIVSQAMVYESEDSALGPAQFGPNTPHYVSSTPLITGDQGLVVSP